MCRASWERRLMPFLGMIQMARRFRCGSAPTVPRAAQDGRHNRVTMILWVRVQSSAADNVARGSHGFLDIGQHPGRTRQEGRL